MMKKKFRFPNSILLTGGTGFLGRRLLNVLLLNGYHIHLIVRRSSKLNHLRLRGKVSVYEHDGTTNQMIDIIATAQPDVVMHLAASVVSDHSPEEVIGLIQSNLLFGTQLLEAMRINNIKKIVNTGTFWQHLNGDIGNPVSLYAATKQAFEVLLDYHVQAHGFQAISLILFDNYGPGDTRSKLFTLLEKSNADGIPIDMSAGEQLIDIVHIDDVVNAYLIALNILSSQSNPIHSRYSVSSKNPIKLRELVKLFVLHSGLNPKVNWGAKPYRPREIMIPWSGGENLPGWHPHISLTEGFKGLFKKS